ncbi:MAG: hypothetical protein J5956_09915 [Ruminococcus sp.]|nr:hypothetical protein [Ruminococcus sp.]
MKRSTKKNVARKAISLAWVSAVMSAIFAVTASAESEGVKGITDWLISIAKDLKVIGYVVGVVAVIVLAIIIIAGGSGGLQKGKAIAVPILVGIAVLSFGTGILGSLAGKDKVPEVAYDATSGIEITENSPYDVSIVDFQ